MSEDTQQTDNNQSSEITLEQLQADLDSAMNGWKRTAADFENFKKRKEAENKELVEFAKEVTVVKLLPSIDSLEQALRHMPELRNEELGIRNQEAGSISPAGEAGNPDSAKATTGRQEFIKQYKNWQEGIMVLIKQLDKVLEELGVKKIEAIGKKFDPYKHEAVREVESEKDDQIVVDEIQSGFELNGKVIRPSQVIISKRK